MASVAQAGPRVAVAEAAPIPAPAASSTTPTGQAAAPAEVAFVDTVAEVPSATAAVGLDVERLTGDISTTVSEQIAKGLSENVQAELRAVRDAITAAEVRAVAADARTDALRAEKGRLEAQLKRTEADIEYWRSQHDRLDKDLDRERIQRVAADKAKAVAEAETREVRGQVASLSTELHETQGRERSLLVEEGRLRSELDQATVSMGWWSRRRFERLQARSAASTPPPPTGE